MRKSSLGLFLSVVMAMQSIYAQSATPPSGSGAASIGPVTVQLTGSSKIAPDLDANSEEAMDVIVEYEKLPATPLAERVPGSGGRVKQRWENLNAEQMTLTAAEIRSFAQDPRVLAIHPDRTVRGSLDLTAAATNATVAWSAGMDGSGIGVAVLDSGISPNDHNEPSANVVYSEDFTGTNTVVDVYGHGTHVAGIIASKGKGWTSHTNSTPTNYLGLARGAHIINLRVLDSTGAGKDSWVINAINRAIALRVMYNIRVMNLSLGRPFSVSYKNDPLCKAVEAAWKAGIVVVVAAGNHGRLNAGGNKGYGTINAPGNDPYVITVGAMKTNETPGRADDTIASYSSKGPSLLDRVVKPDIVAPGNRVLSDAGWLYNYTFIENGTTKTMSANSLWRNFPVGGPLQQFMRLSGTSMATPVVSAAAAILIKKDPTLTPDQVKARLMKTANKSFPASSVATDPVSRATFTNFYDVFTVGAGYLDIAAALANNEKPVGLAVSPSVTRDLVGRTNLVTGTSIVWGDRIIWGSSTAWTPTSIWGTRNLQQNSIVWGDTTVIGNSVVWGDTISRSTSVVWGDSTAILNASTVLVNGDR